MTSLETLPLMIRPRKLVETLESYVAPPEGRHAMIRMDFNENTQGFESLYPPSPRKEWFLAYPEYTTFLQKLAGLWQVPENCILLTNGSDEGLSLIASTFIEPLGIELKNGGKDLQDSTAIVSTPTFAMIPHYLKLAGAHLKEIPVVTNSLEFDISAIEVTLAQGAKLAIFASPDNPTGAVLKESQVIDWCKKFPETLFTIDEAYVEFTGGSVLPRILDTPNLMVTRTFSKAWGLAGVRLGAVLAHPQLIEYLYRVRSPYSVNALAIDAASRLLENPQMIMQAAQETMTRKAALIQGVKDRGYQVIPGHGNFFLLKAGIDAQPISDYCYAHGILIRNRSPQRFPLNHPLWGMIRVTVGSDEENQRFLACLDGFRNTSGLLFDMDDTLVDTSKSFDVTVKTLVEKYSNQPLAPETLRDLRAEGGFNDDWDATCELLRRRGIEKALPEIEKEGKSLYFQIAPTAETFVMKETLLQQLSKRYRLFVVTGRKRDEYLPLWAEKMDPLFEKVYCRDDRPELKAKPEPDPLLCAMGENGILHGFYVGNSVDDVKACLAAQLTPIGVTSTHSPSTLAQAGAACIFESINDIGKVFLL
ncbi:MAG: aminotransferase class I/II-fold pyridoxal phosphate-dependent enzyme [Cyanobacteria bacterium]|nr:aminotransferase class I/II-fold pyridoxal phosphate-dependent enzyme [Cyanobacteriota bacterium]